ncbi:hypothetical protein ABEB36_002922 [Hypothenemus hampei]|uniref:RING-type E3 ubiquitin transferase n=1 Tax=Hypothenemus hampei TaxID=57062 RepID=A0ABD1F7H1_HYPHA
MHIRIKASWHESKDKRECFIRVSKTTSIEELRMLIKKNIDLDPELQRLFYKGKELVNGLILNDYLMKINDVIIVTKRMIIEPVPKNVSTGATNAKDESAVEKLLIESVSKYYKIGDLVDVRLPDSGAWYEATIKKIFKKSSSANDPESLIFQVISENHASAFPIEEDTSFENIRPRSYYIYKYEEIKPGMKVLANYNIDTPKERGLWYDFYISEMTGPKQVTGTVFVGEGNITDCHIKFTQELMRIESPSLIDDRNDKLPMVKRKYPIYCNECRDNKNKSCKSCGCKICAGKRDPHKLIICDECETAYHIYCLQPPLEIVPDDDWYCIECKTDDSQIVKAGEKVKVSRKHLSSRKNSSSAKQVWGQGMACVGVNKINDRVKRNHVGPVPGVEVGFCWKHRAGVSEYGIHRPLVAGIHGRQSECAYSLVLSGGYEDDKDDGFEFLYTGSGGRDLSEGNKRTDKQCCDQKLTLCNKALALNCNAQFDDQNGAEAEDWKSGKPVRVVRNCKMKDSKYAPEDGYRYDGIYKVVKYYPELGKAGYRIWRYLLRRDDPSPAPWEPNAPRFDIIYQDGYLESQEANSDKKLNNKSLNQGKKRKLNNTNTNSLLTLFHKKQKTNDNLFKLDPTVSMAIDRDVANKHLWIECLKIVEQGKIQFLKAVEETFKCIICFSLILKPVTLECGHTLCEKCLKDMYKHSSMPEYQCPCCRMSLGNKNDLHVRFKNLHLEEVLNLLFVGYGTK